MKKNDFSSRDNKKFILNSIFLKKKKEKNMKDNYLYKKTFQKPKKTNKYKKVQKNQYIINKSKKVRSVGNFSRSNHKKHRNFRFDIKKSSEEKIKKCKINPPKTKKNLNKRTLFDNKNDIRSKEKLDLKIVGEEKIIITGKFLEKMIIKKQKIKKLSCLKKKKKKGKSFCFRKNLKSPNKLNKKTQKISEILEKNYFSEIKNNENQNRTNIKAFSSYRKNHKNLKIISFDKMKKEKVFQNLCKEITEKKIIKSKLKRYKSEELQNTPLKRKKRKRKKQKRKKRKFPQMRSLIPQNLSEEKEKFYSQNQNYNPIFKYKSPIKKFSSKPHKKLLFLANKILTATLTLHKSYKKYEKLGGNPIKKSETSEKIDAYLLQHNLSKNITYRFDTNRITPTCVVHNKNGKTEIILKTPVSYREHRILDLLNHEIGTHCIRKYNDRVQIWHNKRKRYKLGNFLEIEEGLGSLNTLYERACKGLEVPFLYDAALNYLSACWAEKMSFCELYKALKKFVDCEDKVWMKCLRVKRGLEHTSIKGGMYKDQVYFIGAVEILRNRGLIDFYDLYSGKINLRDCVRLKRVNLISRGRNVFPYFLKDQEEYRRVLDKIAKANFID